MQYVDMTGWIRRARCLLIVVSLATVAVLVYDWVRENISPEWRQARLEYLEILKEKAVDQVGKDAVEAFEIRIVQNVLPELNTVDRCVTCHAGIEDPRMTDQKQPFKTHSGRYLEHHPPERFGCTSCHHGQGRALVSDEARAVGYHWNYPFLPRAHMEAECGRCHAGIVMAGASAARDGRLLFRGLGCTDCHRLDGEGTGQGLDLSDHGLALTARSWADGHPGYAADPTDGRPAFAEISTGDIALLQEFLRSRHGAPGVAHGKYLYKRFGCGGCHKIDGSGGVLGPDLSNEGLKIKEQLQFDHVAGDRSVPNWLYRHFLAPAQVSADSEMPRLDMTESDAVDLTTYMLSLQSDRDLSARYLPADSMIAGRSIPSGAEAFGRYCSYCHGTGGGGNPYTSFGRSAPGILNVDFLRVAGSDYIREVVASGRPVRDMPKWRDGLGQAVVDRILLFIDSHRTPAIPTASILKNVGDIALGATTFAEHCSVCHGARGEGLIGPRLNDPAFLALADDSFIYRTIVTGRPDSPMPSWSDLSEERLSGLLALFREWRKSSGAAVPAGRVPSKGDAVSAFVGQPAYQAQCASCHGGQGEGGPAVALHNQTFLSLADAGYIAGSLTRCRAWSKGGAGGRPVGPEKMSPDMEQAVADFVMSWRDAPRPVARSRYRPLHGGDPIAGGERFARDCAGCHGSKGVKGVAPAIGSDNFLTTVSDGYLAATIAVGRGGTIMEARGINAPGHVEPMNGKDILDVVSYLRSLGGK